MVLVLLGGEDMGHFSLVQVDSLCVLHVAIFLEPLFEFLFVVLVSLRQIPFAGHGPQVAQVVYQAQIVDSVIQKRFDRKIMIDMPLPVNTTFVLRMVCDVFLKLHGCVSQKLVCAFSFRLLCGLHESVDHPPTSLPEPLTQGHSLSVRIVHVTVLARDFGRSTLLAVRTLLEVCEIRLPRLAALTDELNTSLLAFDPRSHELASVLFTES